MSLKTLLNRIRQEQTAFPAAQRLVAAYVLENYSRIPFQSITVMAQNCGVSENTVVQFCKTLGFDKFTQFKKILSEHAHEELVIFNKFSDPHSLGDPDCFSQANRESTAAIAATLSDPVNKENLPKLLNMLDKARNIYITGGRASAMLAGLLTNMLRYLGLKVFEVNTGIGDYLDRMSMIEKEDLVIAVSLPRYTASIVEGLKELREKGVPIGLITDTGLSPALPYADVTLYCSVTSSYYFPCLAGCVALIETICRAAAASRKSYAAEHVRELEQSLLEKGIFL